MPAITVRYRTDDVWNECDAYHIDADAIGNMDGWAYNDWGLVLYDSIAGGPSELKSFVLFSPDLNNKTIARLLTVRKENLVPSGFRVSQARFYTNIYVVDPDGDISDAALAPLVEPGKRVVRVPGNTPKEMSDNLKALLS